MASSPVFEARGFHWKLRRHVDRTAAYFEKGTLKTYPKTAIAFDMLREAMDAEISTRRYRTGSKSDRKPAEPPLKKQRTDSSGSRKYYHQARRLEILNKELRAKRDSHTAVTAGGKLISPDWNVKMFLTRRRARTPAV